MAGNERLTALAGAAILVLAAIGGGREWVCAQATGEVLEVAVGTGRNLPFYPDGVRLTGIDFSSAMLDIARTGRPSWAGRLVRHRGVHAGVVRLPG